MSENVEFPDELRYNKDNSWVKVDGDVAVVGINHAGASKAKEFVFIKLPSKGNVLDIGADYVSVEAVKWSGHLSAPVSGEIIDVNEDLFDDPARINSDPYGSWIMKVRMKDKEEIDALMDADEAKKFYS